MAQQLIVEGSDGIVITNLCMKRGISPPKGYSNPEKFKKEFIKRAGSDEKALAAFREALDNSSLDNIGLVIDANENGPNNRWNSIKAILKKKFPERDFTHPITAEGIVIEFEKENLRVGIWIMLDNSKRLPGAFCGGACTASR